MREVLGTKDRDSGLWDVTILSRLAHNGENPVEASKVRETHPNELNVFSMSESWQSHDVGKDMLSIELLV